MKDRNVMANMGHEHNQTVIQYLKDWLDGKQIMIDNVPYIFPHGTKHIRKMVKEII